MNNQPISRYAGGKRKLLPEILARMPKTFGPEHRLIELYAGGAALFWHLTTRRKPQRAVLVERNPHILNLYRQIKEAPVQVNAHLREIHGQENAYGIPQAYLETRQSLNEAALDTAQVAAQTLYLLRRCFNGLWRVSRTGSMNTPVGKWTKSPPSLPTSSELLAYSAALGRAEITSTFCEVEDGDVVFADPPYWGGFTAYTARGFSWVDQTLCAEALRALSWQGATVIATNSDTPEIRALYAGLGFKVEETSRSGNMNSKTTARGRVGEVIIT